MAHHAGTRLLGYALIFLGIFATSSAIFAASAAGAGGGGSGEITLIHIGDIHGHLTPRPNMRSDGEGRMVGGLARMYTLIEQIRKRHKHTLLLNTGDTIQGSAEALYTRGQALVDVVNLFKLDAYAPGNWEFVYGTDRFLELFAGPKPKAPWNTIAANVYYDGEPYANRTGQHVLPPFMVRDIGGLRVGFIGLTTRRGPQVVGTAVTKGFRFTNGDVEVPMYLRVLRDRIKVDLVVMLSEQELANNVRLAEANPGIDVIFSSDMHEITRQPIVTRTGTVIVEEGQDGTVLGELTLKIKSGKVEKWDWRSHTIDDRLAEHKRVAAKIAEIRKTFVAGPHFKQHVNPFNGTQLARPIDTVVGHTRAALHRSNFSHEPMAGVIEGSSHNFLTDAFREQAKADIGAIRGFRYGTHVAPGPIKMEDLYHFIPIGPMIARGTIRGQQLKNQIENAANGSFDPSVADWTGGWLFGFSGVTMDFNAYAGRGSRASGIQVQRFGSAKYEPLDVKAEYSYASYYYSSDPKLINVVPSTNISVLRDEKGNVLDGVEVVVRYLQSRPDKTVDPKPNRIRVVKPLPKPQYGNPEVQPLRGAFQ
ncbi:MAG: bifunctional metallophosphatase/5'-nucleotidase [Betaproteobacteria bacterium]|nr:bifunctional metallophosphatase/5'-nucleotidase [Betaproteobacteria bacterium]